MAMRILKEKLTMISSMIASALLVLQLIGSVRAQDDSEDHAPPVSAEDLQILDKANALLSDEAHWNRDDTRECPPNEVKLSLFCALHKACIDVLGHYEHRRAALQEVRFAVEEATKGRDFQHRLMDFNNLPETRFEDIKHVLAQARAKVSERLKTERLKS
jgi:hypothetical protein